MADNEIKVTFKAFNEEFNKAVREMKSESAKLRSEYKLQEEQLAHVGTETDKLTAKMDYLEKAHALAADRVDATYKQLQKAKEMYGENSNEVDKLERQLLNAQIAEQKLANQLTETNKDLEEQTNIAKRAASSLQETGDKLKNIGGSMSSTATPAILGFGAGATAAATQVDQAQGSMQAQLGLTAEQAEKLNEQAKNLWEQGFGADMADVTTKVATVTRSLGELNDADLATIISGVEVLESQFGADTQEQIVAVKTLMDNFGMSATEAMDYLVAGFQKGLDYSGEFIDTIREYSTYFNEMGFSGQEFFDVLAGGAENGAFQLDKVGDAMKEFTLRSKDTADSTVDAFKGLGLNAAEMISAFNAGGEEGRQAFEKTVTALMGVEDATKRNQIATDLFGTQYEDLGGKAFQGLLEASNAMGDVEGRTRSASEAVRDNFGVELQIVLRQLQDALVPLGSVLTDFATRIMPTLSSAVQTVANWFTNLSPSGQNLVVIIGAIAAAAGPLLAGLGFIAQGIAGLIGPVTTAIGWLSKLGPLFTVIRTALTALTGPVGIVIAIVVALAILIYKNWDEIKAKTIEIWGAISAWLSSTIDSIKQFFSNAWENIKQSTTTAFEAIKSFFESIWEGIKNLFNTIVEAIVKFVLDRWENLKNNTSTVFEAISKAISVVWEGIKTFFTTVIEAIVGFIKQRWENLKSNTIAVFDAVKTAISTVWETIKTTVSNIVETIKNAIRDKFEAMKSTVSDKMASVKSTIVEIWNSAKSFLTGINLLQIGKDIIQGLIDGIRSKINAVKDAIKDAASAITSKVKSILDINSPSRVLMEIGEFTGEGLAIGIKSMKSTVAEAAEVLANSSIPDISTYSGVQSPHVISERMPQSVISNTPPIHVTVVSELDGYEVARATYEHIDRMQTNDIITATRLLGGKG